jgi:hypothetical protein
MAFFCLFALRCLYSFKLLVVVETSNDKESFFIYFIDPFVKNCFSFSLAWCLLVKFSSSLINTYAFFHSPIVSTKKRMTSPLLIIFLFIVLNCINAIQIGTIYNASLILILSGMTMNASTCDDCLCSMLISTENRSILSLNCFSNDRNSVTCQLFDETTYRYSSFSQMKTDINSTFYFRQLPSIDSSETTAMTTTAMSTGKISILNLNLKII